MPHIATYDSSKAYFLADDDDLNIRLPNLDDLRQMFRLKKFSDRQGLPLLKFLRIFFGREEMMIRTKNAAEDAIKKIYSFSQRKDRQVRRLVPGIRVQENNLEQMLKELEEYTYTIENPGSKRHAGLNLFRRYENLAKPLISWIYVLIPPLILWWYWPSSRVLLSLIPFSNVVSLYIVIPFLSIFFIKRKSERFLNQITAVTKRPLTVSSKVDVEFPSSDEIFLDVFSKKYMPPPRLRNLSIRGDRYFAVVPSKMGQDLRLTFKTNGYINGGKRKWAEVQKQLINSIRCGDLVFYVDGVPLRPESNAGELEGVSVRINSSMATIDLLAQAKRAGKQTVKIQLRDDSQAFFATSDMSVAIDEWQEIKNDWEGILNEADLPEQSLILLVERIHEFLAKKFTFKDFEDNSAIYDEIREYALKTEELFKKKKYDERFIEWSIVLRKFANRIRVGAASASTMDSLKSRYSPVGEGLGVGESVLRLFFGTWFQNAWVRSDAEAIIPGISTTWKELSAVSGKISPGPLTQNGIFSEETLFEDLNSLDESFRFPEPHSIVGGDRHGRILRMGLLFFSFIGIFLPVLASAALLTVNSLGVLFGSPELISVKFAENILGLPLIQDITLSEMAVRILTIKYWLSNVQALTNPHREFLRYEKDADPLRQSGRLWQAVKFSWDRYGSLVYFGLVFLAYLYPLVIFLLYGERIIPRAIALMKTAGRKLFSDRNNSSPSSPTGSPDSPEPEGKKTGDNPGGIDLDLEKFGVGINARPFAVPVPVNIERFQGFQFKILQLSPINNFYSFFDNKRDELSFAF